MDHTPASHRKSVRLSGYVNTYAVEYRPERISQNALGYSHRQPPCWKFYIKLTQAGVDYRSQYGHYGLNLVTSSSEQAEALTLRLDELKEGRDILTFDAPVSFANWTRSSTDRFACGAIVGIPAEVILGGVPTPADEDDPLTTEELLTSLDRQRLHLEGTIELFSVEIREPRPTIHPAGFRRLRQSKSWRINVLLLEEGCSPAGTLGRYGLNFYTTSRQELHYIQRCLSYLQTKKKAVALDCPVTYFEWLDKRTGDFRCGSALELPLEIVDFCPD